MSDISNLAFNKRSPHIVVVDNFYRDPDAVRRIALSAEYSANNRFYKGKRTVKPYFFPYLREEFCRLLQADIVDWTNQPMNGIFQITSANDPLVYHSDTQDYAAAIYLTPDAKYSMGTSFWSSKTGSCRRPPEHPLENKPLVDQKSVYNDYSILHSDAWELVDKVGCVYNRLVLWDAKLIHSASEYGEIDRLVHLFFFNIRHY